MKALDLSEFDGHLIDGLDFCARVYSLFERIRNSPDGPSRLRMRASDVEKKLIEELFPICKYVQTNYQAGRYISVRWLNGNQQFDAEVVQSGALVELGGLQASSYFEVTCVMHPNEYLGRERNDTTGYSFGLDGLRRLRNREIESVPISYTNQEFIQSYSPLLVEQIRKKNCIPYPRDTILIVQCFLNNAYLREEWATLIAEVRDEVVEHQFLEIFIYDSTGGYSCSL